ncbi:unnamed protein product [Bursaphelenchus okinawaensis]|uniref:Choline/carnitine acyltransferase domain-containing protein n=1 Tax=Bursaphelenchus okinawaensis TaxID=465554 RepID=A0A811KTC0_9BILA|nr:unnamed protein product [Bursaphelenchus okinawaensis]CAG9110765.1 unnamed protein product [Bursaphelenchus okinawaensis]
MLSRKLLINRISTNLSCRSSSNFENRDNDEAFFKSNDYQLLQQSKLPTWYFQKSLRRLPIPKLEDSVKRYLYAVEAVCSPEQLKEAQEVAEPLVANSELQAKLKEYDDLHPDTSYISEPWFDMYLKARVPVPINYNPFMMFSPDPRPECNDQLLRATYMSIAAGRFKKAMDKNLLEPEIYHVKPKWSKSPKFVRAMKLFPEALAWYGAVAFQAFPLDMSQYPSLFGGNRIPKLNKDQLHHADKPQHMLVVRHGVFYKVNLFDKDYNLRKPHDIYADLAGIVKNGAKSEADQCVGSLTTLDRDTWANTRDEILANSTKNLGNLKVIDDALFILCLDEEKLTDHSQLANHLLCGGDGRNRWFDKCFQLIVDGNGQATINFEHSWGDGVAVLRLIEESYRDTQRMNWIDPNNRPKENSDGVQKLEWDLSSSTKSTIKQAQEKFVKAASDVQFAVAEYTDLTRDEIKAVGISPDSTMQLAIQLAFYRTQNRFGPTYESCSTAAWKKGRTECVRSASVATRDTVLDMVENNVTDPKTLLERFKQCSEVHGKLVKLGAMGQGFDRHLLGLKITAERNNLPIPQFYNSQVYNYMNNFEVSTSTLSTEAIVFGGFGPVVKNGYGIGYNVGKTKLGAVVSTFKDERDAQKFCENLLDSLATINKVFKGKQ